MMKVLFVFAALFVGFVVSEPLLGTVYYRNGELSMKTGVLDTTNGAAWGHFEDDLDTVGWGRFDVTASTKFNSTVQMMAAGYLEGAFLSERISQHRLNLWDWYLSHYVPGGKWSPKLLDFLQSNLDYTRSQATKLGGSDSYWASVGEILSQFDGLVLGYRDHHSETAGDLSEFDLWMFNCAGDLLDLGQAVTPSEMRLDFESMTSDEAMEKSMRADHCSGLVRLTDDDLFVSQDAWFFFGAMNRVYKHYDIAGRKMTLSSYPGLLYSFDDFYVTDQGLSFVETTNEIFNSSLYDRITENCVVEWMRARVAAQVATSAEEWTEVFSRENSGSYNNQWLVVDYKKFVKNSASSQPAGLLWVLEQIPGYVYREDITNVLVKQGYFPSYNIPYNKYIFDISGYPMMVNKTGDFWTYDKCPRAQIFARDAVKVNSLSDMQHMMRYNDWQEDPLSQGDPGNAVCSRYDLKKPGQPRFEMFGCLDTKIVDSEGASSLRTHVISSPTYDEQPVWDFATSPQPVPHRGLPDEYDFPWQTFEWDWFR